MSNDSSRRSKIGLVLVIGAVLLVLTIVFGFSTTRSHGEYAEYEKKTLSDPEHPPAWERGELDVDACVDETVAWGMGCPGVQSWCVAKAPEVMAKCLESRDRSAYCAEVGDAVMSTRFGFPECERRLEAWDADEERYARRAAKKYCAVAHRAIAGHCQPVPGR